MYLCFNYHLTKKFRTTMSTSGRPASSRFISNQIKLRTDVDNQKNTLTSLQDSVTTVEEEQKTLDSSIISLQESNSTNTSSVTSLNTRANQIWGVNDRKVGWTYNYTTVYSVANGGSVWSQASPLISVNQYVQGLRIDVSVPVRWAMVDGARMLSFILELNFLLDEEEYEGGGLEVQKRVPVARLFRQSSNLSTIGVTFDTRFNFSCLTSASSADNAVNYSGFLSSIQLKWYSSTFTGTFQGAQINGNSANVNGVNMDTSQRTFITISSLA
jgi:hypothetical protein